jgi:hypothetical protein
MGKFVRAVSRGKYTESYHLLTDTSATPGVTRGSVDRLSHGGGRASAVYQQTPRRPRGSPAALSTDSRMGAVGPLPSTNRHRGDPGGHTRLCRQTRARGRSALYRLPTDTAATPGVTRGSVDRLAHGGDRPSAVYQQTPRRPRGSHAALSTDCPVTAIGRSGLPLDDSATSGVTRGPVDTLTRRARRGPAAEPRLPRRGHAQAVHRPGQRRAQGGARRPEQAALRASRAGRRSMSGGLIRGAQYGPSPDARPRLVRTRRPRCA